MKKYRSPFAKEITIAENKIAADVSNPQLPDGTVETEKSDTFFPGAW